nr:hypothetical protein Iba_scaffold38214CG0010 [Ipomoea batatas]
MNYVILLPVVVEWEGLDVNGVLPQVGVMEETVDRTQEGQAGVCHSLRIKVEAMVTTMILTTVTGMAIAHRMLMVLVASRLAAFMNV